VKVIAICLWLALRSNLKEDDQDPLIQLGARISVYLYAYGCTLTMTSFELYYDSLWSYLCIYPSRFLSRVENNLLWDQIM